MYTGDAQPLAPIPPAVKRLHWWYTVPCVLSVALWGVSQVPIVLSSLSPAITSSAMILMTANIGLLFAAAGMRVRGQRRIRRAVAATRGRSCVSCLYDLSVHQDTGNCPECGHTFDTSADCRSWDRVNML